MYNINQNFRIIVSKHFDNIYFRINLCNLMITCMKFILLEGQQSEKVVSRCLTSSALSWICTWFQVLRKTWNWLTKDKLSWNRFSPPFFSDSKKIDEFRHAKQVLLVNPISSLVVKCHRKTVTRIPAPNVHGYELWFFLWGWRHQIMIHRLPVCGHP